MYNNTVVGQQSYSNGLLTFFCLYCAINSMRTWSIWWFKQILINLVELPSDKLFLFCALSMIFGDCRENTQKCHNEGHKSSCQINKRIRMIANLSRVQTHFAIFVRIFTNIKRQIVSFLSENPNFWCLLSRSLLLMKWLQHSRKEARFLYMPPNSFVFFFLSALLSKLVASGFN